MSKKHILLFDTTLRDGEQAPGNSMSLVQKLKLFEQIDLLGVDYIETGFPASSSIDFDATKLACLMPNRQATVVAFARPTKRDIDIAVEAFAGAKKVQLQLLYVGSEIHLVHKRKMSVQDSISEIEESIAYAKSIGVTDISMGLEDASRGTLTYLKRIIAAGIKAGASTVVFADTVGAVLPDEFGEMVKEIKQFISDCDVILSVHCHNDLGLATANALAGIRAGADCVQATLCGIGERAGNTAIEEIVTALMHKKNFYQAYTTINPKILYDACQLLVTTLGLKMSVNKPIVGKYVFTTAAGIHINGLMKNPMTYEYVKPELFGKHTEFVISKHSGRTALKSKLSDLALSSTDEVIDLMYQKLMSDENLVDFNDENSLKNLYHGIKNNPKFQAIAV
jgi:2-isopropylmalate synthase